MTKLQTKSLRHTFVRDGRFYFSRRVPADLKDHYRVPRIVRALGTSSPREAQKLANAASAQHDAYWATIRLTRMNAIGHDLRASGSVGSVTASAKLLTASTPDASPAITITEARDLYLRLKGKGRPTTFKAASFRAVAYLVKTCGDKPLNRYTRADALGFRDHLTGRRMSGSSIMRNFSHLNAIINFTVSEAAIEMRNPFRGVYYDRDAGIVERPPIPIDDIRRVQALCYEKDDELRWLIPSRWESSHPLAGPGTPTPFKLHKLSPIS